MRVVVLDDGLLVIGGGTLANCVDTVVMTDNCDISCTEGAVTGNGGGTGFSWPSAGGFFSGGARAGSGPEPIISLSVLCAPER